MNILWKYSVRITLSYGFGWWLFLHYSTHQSSRDTWIIQVGFTDHSSKKSQIWQPSLLCGAGTIAGAGSTTGSHAHSVHDLRYLRSIDGNTNREPNEFPSFARLSWHLAHEIDLTAMNRQTNCTIEELDITFWFIWDSHGHLRWYMYWAVGNYE